MSTNVRGILLIVTGFALFSVSDALLKHLAGGYHLLQPVFFNALFSLVPIVAFALLQGGPRMLATKRPGVQALRGLCGVAAAFGAFFGFQYMPMADVYAILFTSPLIITALSGPVLGERVDARRWAAVVVGFVGVVVMLRPGEAPLNVGILGAVVGALGYSLSGMIVRRYGTSETAASYPFYGNLIGTLLVLPAQPFIFVMPTPFDFALMVACGVIAGLALLCMLGAFRIAPAPVVAPFQYTQMLWGVLLGMLIFGDMPSPWLAVGGGIVVASGIYLLRREAKGTDGAVGEAV